MPSKFYITTAIDYPNGNPHMGHAYEKIVTDAYARWHRFLGHDTYFLTGTDENGQKLQESAKAAGKETQAFVDENVEVFKNLCKDLNISNDDFIRTTEERHSKVATSFWKRLEEKGDLYFGKYSGHYCISCENFYTELQAPDLICPHHNKELELKEEDGYFFKITNYKDWILNYIKTNEKFIVPKRALNEIVSRLEKEDLRDIAFSRPNNGWGIPVPGNPDFVMYTWCDALVNYYSALEAESKLDYWPASVHVIGKDITWFHTIIWPCMLHALDIPVPTQVYVHGMVLGSDGRKMSKSLNNGVDPYDMIKKYPLDTFRYYILRGIPAQSDGAFSEDELIAKHNNELGNDFGNLIMRVVKLSLKNLPEVVSGEGVEQIVKYEEVFEKMKVHMENREHNKALDVCWEAVNQANQLVNDTEPWKLKNDPEKLTPVVYNCLYAIHALSLLLSPFLPASAANTFECLGVEGGGFETLEFGKTLYNLKTPEALFPKIDS